MDQQKGFPWAIVITVVILGLLGYGGYRVVTSVPSGGTYTPGPVHWHGFLTMSACGESKSISTKGSVGHHVGLPLLHTHGDDWIHIEGRIISKDDITLGKFFDAVDVPFGTDRFFEKRGADACNDGNPDTLKVTVNGAVIADPENYSVRDQDKIEIKFE